MMEVVNQDYIMTAKAKGLSTFRIVVHHQIRNAIVPIVTILGPLTAALLTGTSVVEIIFAVPGMGRYYVNGIEGQPPDLFSPPAGCGFAPRCDYCMKICRMKQPEMYDISDNHTAACWLHHEKGKAHKLDWTVNSSYVG